MNCLSCKHNNPATVTYCQRCGGKLDLTADEISASLFESAKGEQAKNTEYYARQTLFFGLVLFLIGAAVFALSGGAPETAYHLPSACGAAKHIRFEYKIDRPIPEVDLPLETK